MSVDRASLPQFGLGNYLIPVASDLLACFLFIVKCNVHLRSRNALDQEGKSLAVKRVTILPLGLVNLAA